MNDIQNLSWIWGKCDSIPEQCNFMKTSNLTTEDFVHIQSLGNPLEYATKDAIMNQNTIFYTELEWVALLSTVKRHSGLDDTWSRDNILNIFPYKQEFQRKLKLSTCFFIGMLTSLWHDFDERYLFGSSASIHEVNCIWTTLIMNESSRGIYQNNIVWERMKNQALTNRKLYDFSDCW